MKIGLNYVYAHCSSPEAARINMRTSDNKAIAENGSKNVRS